MSEFLSLDNLFTILSAMGSSTLVLLAALKWATEKIKEMKTETRAESTRDFDLALEKTKTEIIDEVRKMIDEGYVRKDVYDRDREIIALKLQNQQA